ncbi:MAG: extracellular solute-binding protein [Phycisphaerae bacterium]
MKSIDRGLIGLILAVVLVGGTLPTGCSERYTSRADRSKSVKSLTVLTPVNADIQTAFADGFSFWYQRTYDKNVEIEIDWVVRGTPTCVELVRGWFTSAPEARLRSTPDVLFGGGVTDHQVLAEAGWARPVALGEVAESLPTDIGGIPTRDEEGRWHAIALARFGILYNQQVCEARRIDPPECWSDLGDPRFAGWLGLADPSASGTTRQSFMLILQEQGWERGWATIMRILGNARALTQRSTQALDQVVSGESIAAFAINYDGQRRVAESGGRLRFVVPQGVSSVSPAVVSVLKSAREPALAEAFVRYNLSEEGQKLWGIRSEYGSVNAPTLYHYPIVPSTYEKFGAELAMQDNPLTLDHGRDLDLAKSRAQLAALEPLLTTATHGGNHLLLQRAWEAITSAGMPKGPLAELTAAPLDENGAYALGKRYRQLSEYESLQMVAEWTQRMRARYERVTEGLSES